jgi:hypothetical protein
MKFSEFGSTILSTTKDDWHHEACWGWSAGPSYKYGLDVWIPARTDNSSIEIKSHANVAVLKQNLSISIAWGMEQNDTFQEEWLKSLSDSSASSHFLDFFYNQTLVLRDTYLSVDGGRYYIPLPTVEMKEDKSFELYALKEKIDFYRVLNSFVSTYDYNYCISRLSIKDKSGKWFY